jgi:hypothetical protein
MLLPQTGEQVLVLDSGGNEFRARGLHFGKQPFAGFIDEGDILKVHNGGCAWRALAGLVPART